MLGRQREPGWRWVVLAVGTLTQAATCSFVYGIAFLVPALRTGEHLSPVQAGLVVSAPVAGLLLTLVAWGAAADRYGERVVIASGVGLAAALLFASRLAGGAVGLCVVLALAGAAAASVNAASGRVVMGWFDRRQRGLAMGTRQTAQPLGVGIAALTLPPLAHRFDARTALLFPAVFCAVCAVAVIVLVLDPPRATVKSAESAASPYRGVWTLWRVHTASAMLVIPQFTVATFTLVYLVGQRHWDPVDAGRLIFGYQLLGAAGRIGSGVWSDRVASRLRPMRQLAVVSAALMALLAVGAATHAWWIVAVFGAAAVITVADNGLAYIAVAEIAGTQWSGRALGVHNTGQNIAAVITAPVLAAVIGDTRYALGFGLVVITAALAVPLTPVVAESRRVDAVHV